MKPIAFLFAVALVVAAAPRGSSQSMFAATQAWGPSAQGLRMGISVSPGDLSPAATEFDVALQNTGDSDFVVNLGHMLANGKWMFPAAIHLFLADPTGRMRELEFSDRRFPGVAGRVDDFLVGLRRGSTHAIRVSLDQYSSPATKEFQLKLGSGRHRISARFEGHGPGHLNIGSEGVASLIFWKGTVQSNVVEFDGSTQVAPK